MASRIPHVTAINIDTGDYYAVELDNGAVRVGLKDIGGVSFPAGHELRAEVDALTDDSIEDFFDAHCALRFSR